MVSNHEYTKQISTKHVKKIIHGISKEAFFYLDNPLKTSKMLLVHRHKEHPKTRQFRC